MIFKFFRFFFLTSLLLFFSCSYFPEEDSLSKSDYFDHLKYIRIGDPLEGKVGIIIYPGGLVDPFAYLEFGDQLKTPERVIFISKMPYNLAVLQTNHALAIMDEYEDIVSWTIIGHSLGGSMAASVLSNNMDRFDHLILLASYPPASGDLTNFKGGVLSIYGEEDGVADKRKIINSQSQFNNPIEIISANEITEKTEVSYFFEIKGGNHANFGNYGPQNGDNNVELSNEEQQAITISLINALIL